MNGEYQIIDPNNSRPKILAASGLLLILLLLAMGSYFLTKVSSPGSSRSVPVTVQIEPGLSAKQIASLLAAAQLIPSPWVFDWYVYSRGAAGKIQAGEYLLDRKMSITEVVEIITQGRVVGDYRQITVIEGWTNRQIAKRLGGAEFEAAVAAGDFEFRFSDEARPFAYQGFLFPDTYQLAKDDGVRTVIGKMLVNFESKLTKQMLSDIQASRRPLGEIIIIASIVEKEVGRNLAAVTAQDLALMQRERELVASVFYNRLRAGMPLQSDATVNYITGKQDRRPLLADTRVDSPYNTYQVTGLPPTPISNPGLGAILAAIYPAESDYLYFLNSPDGTAYFAETLDGHNKNRAKYLE